MTEKARDELKLLYIDAVRGLSDADCERLLMFLRELLNRESD